MTVDSTTYNVTIDLQESKFISTLIVSFVFILSGVQY